MGEETNDQKTYLKSEAEQSPAPKKVKVRARVNWRGLAPGEVAEHELNNEIEAAIDAGYAERADG